MSKSVSDQLMDMLRTIDETQNFLRKRCASGQAGQSMSLFEDLASLLALLERRYRKSGYLPKERIPLLDPNADILSAVRFLDALDRWSAKTKDKVKRIKIRQELARGGIIEAAVKEGKPFAQQAAEMVQFVRPGSPEERAEEDPGVSVDFSRESVAKARAAYHAAPQPDFEAENPYFEESMPPVQSDAEPDPFSWPEDENARLFASIRARTGIRAPQTRDDQENEAEENSKDMEREFPTRASASRSMRSRKKAFSPAPDDPMESQPMETQEPGPRPMRARPMEPQEPEARPMRARPMEPQEPEARPMRARPMEPQEPEARPMRARPMEPQEPEARPMRARPMKSQEPEDDLIAPQPQERRPTRPIRPQNQEARPAREKVQEGRPMASPERPTPIGNTTAPAVGRGVAIDRDFLRIVHDVRNMSEQELERKLIEGFPKLENRYKMVICDQMRRYGYWGKLEPERSEYEALRRRAQELSQHMDEYSWLYGKLGDYRSRKTLLAILDNWYSYNFKTLANMKEKMFPTYLDADLLRCTEEEVFVDLGAGIGDVTKAFAEYAGHWKKIYCYEPNPGSFSALRNRTKELGLLALRQCAVGDKTGNALLQVPNDDPLLSKIDDNGIETDMVQIDEDIEEPVSIIKMCLEGSEQAAIRGCSNHIHQDHPKLILRADHGDSDLWQLPRMIERLDKKYRFYLRHYGGNLAPMEYILYAV
ncbi:MAG: FkbM family methyltransferase [Oscillospiraceae bacterium]|nr:FkbM family methyltransferase [Oscillospiraceae bacterium]